ncbi:glycosyltransferase family 2 protein [Celerinatantimonas yamalensis]|uniref:Glycosyltransferase family 2 protein n=1 Tax=Celerinatantimonas yamalensis TaxID=559956 RepID=A0ABW9GE12_9GAMM
MSIGVLLITKNEQQYLRRCLLSVCDWCDEIVVVDSGSEDETCRIAREFTDKVYEHPQWPGFGKQRQLAQSYMTSDWVFVIDADEWVTPELRDAILTELAEPNNSNVYQVNRRTKAFGKYIDHSGWSPDWVARLYPRSLTQYSDALVHESVVIPKGCQLKKIRKGRLLHDTYQDLHHYIRKTTGYLKSWTDEREGKRKSGLCTALVHALACFFKMYIINRGFLDGRHGFIVAWLSMHSTFVKYIDLWLRENYGNKE